MFLDHLKIHWKDLKNAKHSDTCILIFKYKNMQLTCMIIELFWNQITFFIFFINVLHLKL